MNPDTTRFDDLNYWFGKDIAGCLLSITLYEIGDLRLRKKLCAFFVKRMFMMNDIAMNVRTTRTPGIDRNLALKVLEHLARESSQQIEALSLEKFVPIEMERELKIWLNSTLLANWRALSYQVSEFGISPAKMQKKGNTKPWKRRR